MTPLTSKSTSRKTLSIYWSYVRRHMALFLVALVGVIAAIIIQGIVPPFIVAQVFNKLQVAYTHRQQLEFDDFLPYFIAYASCMIAGIVFWRGQAFAAWRLEEKVRTEIANDVYDHLQAQSQAFHANRFGGALVSNTNKFLVGYVTLMDAFIWNVIPIVTTVLAALAVLLVVSWQAAAALTVAIAIFIVIMSKRVRKQLPHNESMAKQESSQTAALADAITNMSTIRAFAGEKYESRRFYGVTGHTEKKFKRLSIEVLKTEVLSHIQTNGLHVLAMFIALVAVTSGTLQAAVLYLVIAYTGRIVDQLWQFSRTVRVLSRGLGDAAEMTKMLQIEPEIKDPVNPETVKIHRGEVVFRDVQFAYPENRSPLFQDLNLKVKPGEKIGLVGQSGGGKTTITQLLLRFMNIQAGTISIDGQNVAAITQADLRSRIAYVPQEPILFHRSLAENIGYGDHAASRQAIEAVAKMAHAHDFIEKLPEGYETLVGERGVKLSGGQRQRVAIARAMLKNAPILVLDEATSALDSESEVLIQDALWKLMEGRTAIVIAHRLSTIQKMDRIIVMDEGKIAEEGSHRDLLRQNGIYAKLWTHQSGGFIDGEGEE